VRWGGGWGGVRGPIPTPRWGGVGWGFTEGSPVVNIYIDLYYGAYYGVIMEYTMEYAMEQL